MPSARTLRKAIRHIGPILSQLKSVSFSQYAEDLLIDSMRPQQTGVYVDVGAFHPQHHSNTFRLYLKGWRGVTVEPNPDVASAFQSARPRDRHLTIGIAAEAAMLTYYRFEDQAQSTLDAERAAIVHSRPLGQIQVPCLPLSTVFDEHCAGQHVDLLSIDCETRDLEVASSLDWMRHRPSVIIIEDFEQFDSGAMEPACQPAGIRRFFADREYALASQAIFSSIYVDRHAFAKTDRRTGFRLDQSQLLSLAAR